MADRRRSNLGTRITTLGDGATREGTTGSSGEKGGGANWDRWVCPAGAVGAGGLAGVAIIRPSLLTVVIKGVNAAVEVLGGQEREMSGLVGED